MTANHIINWFEKYSFVIILLFCFGFFSPNLLPKVSLMDNDAIATAQKISGSSITKQLFWLSMFSFFIWRFFQHNILTVITWEMLCVLMFMAGGLALVSTLWSEYPLLTAKRAFFQVIFCFSIISSFYFARRHDVIEHSLFCGAMLIICMIVLSIVMGVAFSSGGNLAAFTKGKNLLGQNLIVLIALLLLQIKLFGQKIVGTKWVLFILCFFLLLTISKTSIALLLLFIVIAHSSLLLIKLITHSAFFLAICCFILVPTLSYFIGDYIHLGLYLEPSAITGRGLIWDTLYYDLEYFSKLLTGYGFGAYFSNGTIPHFFDDDWSFLKHIASSHNGYLDILIQYGLFFSLFIIACLYRLGTGIKHCWLAAAFIIPIVYNLTESAFLKDQSMMWCFTVILFGYVVILKEEFVLNQYTEVVKK